MSDADACTKRARKQSASELLPSSPCESESAVPPRTLQEPIAELFQASSQTKAAYVLKRTLMETASEPHQDAVCKGVRPRLRTIQDPISKLNPEMLYRNIQYVVEEGDWGRQEEEVEAFWDVEERGT